MYHLFIFFIGTSLASAYNKAENNNSLIDNTEECPVDWYYLNGRCLLFSKATVTFDGAIQACGNYSALLASVHSDEEAKALFTKSENYMYIGMWVPTNKEGDPYVNLDGTQPDWVVWNGVGKWEACTVIISEYLPRGLRRVSCSHVARGYICQIPTDKWERLKSDMALKASEQIIRNYTTVLDDLEYIKKGVRDLESIKIKVNEMYQMFKNISCNNAKE